MADNLYGVRVYADIFLLPRGTAGPGLAQNNANIGGYGSAQGPGVAPMAQTMRFQQVEIVPNVITVAPTAANFTTAIQSAGTDIGTQITAAVLAVIQGWATGGP